MKQIIFEGNHFSSLDHGIATLNALLRALCIINADILKRNPMMPLIYQSGARYMRDPLIRYQHDQNCQWRMSETWKDCAQVLSDGVGDCEDLACWRAAELRIRFEKNARVTWRRRVVRGVQVFHILVVHPDGSIEDPSLRLGMGRE